MRDLLRRAIRFITKAEKKEAVQRRHAIRSAASKKAWITRKRNKALREAANQRQVL